MNKYDWVRDQLLLEGIASSADFFEPKAIQKEHLYPVHDQHYIKDLCELNITPRAQRISGFTHTPQLIERELVIMEGTRRAVEKVFQEKQPFAFNIAGGTHHAFSDRGEGFCLLNDLAIAAQYAVDHHQIKHVLILDLDVHQGNGTAQIFQDNPAVFTLSLHGQSNYPFHKERSDLDVALPNDIGDNAYIKALQQALDQLPNQPELVLYQAGVDILSSDKLGKMNVSMEGIKRRDELVFEFVKSIDAPIVTTLGGGYSEDVSTIVNAHCQTFDRARFILE